MATLILKVDLQCRLCSKKIKSTLCKLQDRWDIESITYDEKNCTVTISGPFDAKKLIKKLCCMACRVIKEIKIHEPTTDSTSKAKDVTTNVKTKPITSPNDTSKDQEKKNDPPPVYLLYPDIVPVCCCYYHGACSCCCSCGPGYGECAPTPPGACRRCSCGRGHGGCAPTPPAYGGPCYDGGYTYKSCQLICEEDVACNIM